MKTPIFNLPGSNLYLPSTDLDFQGSNLVNYEAPTSRAPTLYLVQAPTWSLEDSHPLGLQPYLPRHQPFQFLGTNLKGSNPISGTGSNLVSWGLLSSRAPTLSSKAPTLSIMRHQPCLYEAPTSCFNSSRYIWLYFMAPNVFFNKPWQSSVFSLT